MRRHRKPEFREFIGGLNFGVEPARDSQVQIIRMETVSCESCRILHLILVLVHVDLMRGSTISLQILSNLCWFCTVSAENGIEEHAQHVANVLLRKRFWVDQLFEKQSLGKSEAAG
jgi:hypothetical protein